MTAQTRAQLEDALAARFTALGQLAQRCESRIYLPLPYPVPPPGLRANARPHWASRARITRMVRADVAVLARAAGLRPCAHLTVGLVWAPGDHRRRDEDNLVALLKVCADALSRGRDDWIGLRLVPDDTPAFMTKLMPTILPPPLRGLWLLLDPLPENGNGIEQ